VLAFLNAADDLGLCVTGVRHGDIFEHVSVAGNPSFSTETVNKGIAGLIGVVGVGAEAVATAFGHPELQPLIRDARQYAQQQFPESERPSKRRDGYGMADDGSKARQEGGVIVCEPRAQGIYYSATDRDYWIQGGGSRNDANQPRHIPVNDAFFLNRHMGPERLHGAGDLYVCAWDHAFPDNAGFYEVHFILRRRGPDDDDWKKPPSVD
jgi:hypothetical protein